MNVIGRSGIMSDGALSDSGWQWEGVNMDVVTDHWPDPSVGY